MSNLINITNLTILSQLVYLYILSHLLQLLNIELYSPLKPAYNYQINLFIRIFINYITKIEFFIIYLAAHNAVFTKKNIKIEFKEARILP